MAYLSSAEFEKIDLDVRAYEDRRESLIRKSRDIIHHSKRIIHAIHRGDMVEAKKLLKVIEKDKKKLEALAGKDDRMKRVDMLRVGLQEYVEAAAYYEFVVSDKIPTRGRLGVPTEPYITGLCDMSGELIRKSVAEVIDNNFDMALRAKDFLLEFYGELTKLDVGRGEMRKKIDMVRWNLNKIEDIIFNAKLSGRPVSAKGD